MKRREFSAQLGLSTLALGLPGLSLAQGGPIEGRNYQKLPSPLPTTAGKIEVVEFFWYGCPHCYALEPVLKEWTKKLPADVVFRRVHVGFRPNIKLHQRLFFALEGLGLAEQLQERVFDAFHRERLDLDDEKSIIALVTRLGVDTAKFTQMFNSFGVQTKALQGTKLSEAYRIDGVPALGVAGRFLTAPSMAANPGERVSEQELGQRTLATVDFLIQRVRSGKA